MTNSAKPPTTESVPAPDGAGMDAFATLDGDVAETDLQPNTTEIPARRRKAAAEAEIVTMVTLPLSNRVISFFEANAEDWRALINNSLNIIVNRHIAREAKKRARLRAHNSVRRRPPKPDQFT